MSVVNNLESDLTLLNLVIGCPGEPDRLGRIVAVLELGYFVFAPADGSPSHLMALRDLRDGGWRLFDDEASCRAWLALQRTLKPAELPPPDENDADHTLLRGVADQLTLRQIAKLDGRNHSTIAKRLRQLQRLGFVRKAGNGVYAPWRLTDLGRHKLGGPQ